VSDSLGRIVAETPSAPEPGAMLMAEVPMGTGRTIYARTGDVLPWLCLAGVAAMLGALVRRR
jgi:apolipoprotein N-acyltransferase